MPRLLSQDQDEIFLPQKAQDQDVGRKADKIKHSFAMQIRWEKKDYTDRRIKSKHEGPKFILFFCNNLVTHLYKLLREANNGKKTVKVGIVQYSHKIIYIIYLRFIISTLSHIQS